MIIRNQPTPLTLGQGQSVENSTTGGRKSRSRRHGTISGASIASYVGVFLLVVTLVMLGYQPPVHQTALAESTVGSASSSANTANATSVASGMVDQLTATNLASSLAESTDMPISNDVANLSQSLAVESQLSQTDTNVISKPQVVNASADTRTTKQYTAVAGDTVQTVAQHYGISPTTIKWANNLTSDAIEAGKTPLIRSLQNINPTVNLSLPSTTLSRVVCLRQARESLSLVVSCHQPNSLDMSHP